MSVRLATVAEVIGRFIGSLPQEDRNNSQLELSRFMRWFGPEQPIETIDARSLETYQEQVAKTGADQTRRLEPVRNFLSYSQKEGYLASNLAKFLKIKRSTKRLPERSESAEKEVTHLTTEGHAKLNAELDRLITVERPKVTQELWEARQDKDIRENAPYDAAKQHQALVEARIRELEHILATAQIIAAGSYGGGRVSVGATVALRDLTHEEDLRYTLVGPQEANPRAGKISVASPVGRALLDRTVGDVVEVEAPVGVVRYRVERIES